jgi:hypothetical protein
MKYFLLDIKQQVINQLYITNSKDFDLYIIVLYLRGILFLFLFCLIYYFVIRGCRFRGCMVVGFTTTYAISAYHH